MKHIKLFEEFLNEANAFNNFSAQEKKAWKKNENRLGNTYFVPKNEEEYKRMMEFLADKNWSFWNAFGIEGYTHTGDFGTKKIDASSLPTWKAGIGFELGGTRNGSTQIIPTKMTPTTQGAEFDLKTFFDKIVTEAYSESQVERLLNMDPIKITVKPDEVTVVVEGNDLGYDDDQYYKISWYPSDKQVQSGAFKDARCTKRVGIGDVWSEEVKSLEDFADVVNGDADGGWE